MSCRFFSCLLFACLLLVATPTRADPSAAYYAPGPDRLFWLVHVSDTHIGTDWYNEDGRFFWLFQEALPIIQPELVINTGDLVDASKNGIPASGQDEGEWRRYREIVDQAGVPAEFYIDLPGNHDTYNDDLSYYLQWSLNGSTYGKTTRALLLEFDFGTYFFYGCATPGDSAGPFVDPAAFSQEELAEMSGLLSGNADANLILVFGHHPPGDPDRSDEARALWRQYGAQYFHGHVHLYDEYIYDGILTREVDSLGKSKRENLALLAIDGDFVTYEVTDSDDPWPLVVITAPADARLKNGDPNPYAYAVAPDCVTAPVRVLVFDSVPVNTVTFQAGSGAGVAMEQDPVRPMLWLGQWDTSGLESGEIELTVTAGGSQNRSRSIKVLVDASGQCPEPWQPPDGGSGDADGGDADGGSDGSAGDPDGYDDTGNGDYQGADANDADEYGDANQVGDGGVYGGADNRVAADSGCGCAGNRPSPPGLLLLLLLTYLRRQRRHPPGATAARRKAFR